VRGPGIECSWFDSQLFSELFDRQKHTDTHRGRLPTPPSPLCARVSTPAFPLVAATVALSSGPAFLQPSRPARCKLAPCRDLDSSLPRTVVGGRELLSLSDEGLQLVFVQVHPTPPVELLPHLRPTPPHGLQPAKQLQCVREGQGLGWSGGRLG
jgi:hypothetical protein